MAKKTSKKKVTKKVATKKIASKKVVKKVVKKKSTPALSKTLILKVGDMAPAFTLLDQNAVQIL